MVSLFTRCETLYFTAPLGGDPELQAEWESPGCSTHHLPAGARLTSLRKVSGCPSYDFGPTVGLYEYLP
jgi:hypothetical protein